MMLIFENGDLLSIICKLALVGVPISIIVFILIKAINRNAKEPKKKDLIAIPVDHPQAEKLCEEFHRSQWEKIHLTLDGENYLFSCHVCQKFRSKL